MALEKSGFMIGCGCTLKDIVYHFICFDSFLSMKPFSSLLDYVHLIMRKLVILVNGE